MLLHQGDTERIYLPLNYGCITNVSNTHTVFWQALIGYRYRILQMLAFRLFCKDCYVSQCCQVNNHFELLLLLPLRIPGDTIIHPRLSIPLLVDVNCTHVVKNPYRKMFSRCCHGKNTYFKI